MPLDLYLANVQCILNSVSASSFKTVRKRETLWLEENLKKEIMFLICVRLLITRDICL